MTLGFGVDMIARLKYNELVSKGLELEKCATFPANN